MEQFITVLVIYTGGTIGMVKNDNKKLAPVKDKFLENIQQRPDMHDKAAFENIPKDVNPHSCLLPAVEGLSKRIVYTIKEYNPLLDSSNVGAKEWKLIVNDITNNYNSYDAFVVLHGTDTLAYTAAALSFGLQNLNKTVVLTGSQLSIFETRTDGISNFINALAVAGMNVIREVCLVFGNKLIRGNRAAKISAVSFNAFDSPNTPNLGSIEGNIKIYDLKIKNIGAEKFHDKFDTNISILRLSPNIPIETVKAFLAHPIRGVILQSFGSGNVPSNREDILEELTAATNRGVIIVNTTQCRHGAVEAIYEAGQVLADCGVISGFDMTEEAAYAKLAWVLGQNSPLEYKKKRMQENICDELTL